ncbi:TatD family hydrolase [Petroclostridium sp. X23]|uniref:TatD family hydrolase n=1 Tax=Petroclostridium sp. X23 TaxID=3045146 RepID=UPI0024AC9B5F|nr:TatD family hydrolase [Petroclostridium sp. X23]WHH57058.1 TatD family hydrolase [Petroclostridium sp. X23]
MFFDSHAHYDDERFDIDREKLLDGMKNAGVDYVLNAAANVISSKECIKLAGRYDFIYASVGVHPHDVEEMHEETIEELAELSTEPKVVAVGEIGLDYYYDHSPRETQKYWFRKQIQLAKRLNLPVIIHNRDAHADTMEIAVSEDISTIGGVLHCFSGSWEMAKKLLDMGIYISIAGPITFNNVVKSVEVVKNMPMNRMLIETDSPYLTPVPHRGKRNDSTYMRYTAERIAELKGIRVEEVAEKTTENAKRLFRI